MYRKWKYVSQISVVIWISVLLIILVGGWVHLKNQKAYYQEEAEKTLLGISRLKADTIYQWRKTRLADGQRLALNPALRKRLIKWSDLSVTDERARSKLETEMRRQVLPLQMVNYYKSIRIVRRDNTHMFVLAGCCEADVSSGIQATLDAAWSVKQTTLGDIHISSDGTPVFDVVAPMFVGEAYEALGLSVVLVIDPTVAFYPSLQRVPIPSQSYESLLVRQEGESLRFITPLRHLPKAQMAHTLPMSMPELPAARALHGEDGVVAGLDYRGVRVLAVATHIEGTNWALIVKMDEDEALSSQQHDAFIVIVCLILLVVAISALVLFTRNQFMTTQREKEALYQEEINKHNSRLVAVYRAAPLGIGILCNRKFVDLNGALCQLFGYSHDEMLGQSTRRLYLSAEDYVRIGQDTMQKFVAGENYTGECRWKTRDGRVLDVALAASLITPGEPGGDVCFTVSDITERKVQENKLNQRSFDLERSNADLTTFAYVASHDLRSPLRGISQLAEWIKEDMPDTISTEVKDYLDLLGSRVGRMESLLDDLLAYSRVGRIEGEIGEVSVSAICQEVYDLLMPPETFSLILGDNLPTFVTLGTPLTQILRNLIGNAVKHHDGDQGCVTVSVVEAANQYVFTVSDDGPGIPPEYHERIFALFQTLKSRDEIEGSGMGLAIIKKILDVYGEAIRVESPGGRGTKFIFTWPKEAKLRNVLNARENHRT